MRCRVQQAEYRVRRQPGVGFGQLRVQLAQHAHPDLDVLPLRFAHLPLRGVGQVRKVAVLDPDQVGLAQGEVEMEIDEAVQRRRRVSVVGGHIAGTGEQPGADPDQQLDQQRLLVREVPVDGRTADPGGGADVFQPDREETALGEQPFGGRQELQAPVGFQLAAAIWGFGLTRPVGWPSGADVVMTVSVGTLRLIVTNVARVSRY